MLNKNTLLLLLLAGTATIARAQVEKMRYVDFHIHTSMKNYYRDIDSPRWLLPPVARVFPGDDSSNWYGAKHRHGKGFRSGRRFSGFYGKDSRPEASWDQLAAMQPRPWVLCTSITPIEKRFVSEHKVPVLFAKVKIRNINECLVTKLNTERQAVIHEGTSYDELRAEIEFMKRQGPNPNTGRYDVRLVNDSADLAEAIKNRQTGLVLTIEGIHSLMDTSTRHEEMDPTFGIDSSNIIEIKNNVDSLKAMSPHVFFLTLSHMSWNGMCGHAKSLDMNKQWLRLLLGYQSEDKRFRNVATKRYSTTIGGDAEEYSRPDEAFATNPCTCTDPLKASHKTYGMEILKRLLDSTGGKRRILIDTRHLAVQGRQQYIDSVRIWRAAGDTIPIIVSHAAVNGKTRYQAEYFGTCPFQDRYLEVRKTKRFYEIYNRCLPADSQVDVRKTGWFHPFSINLYDEEIAEVANSGGIIGVTLEERVLGTGRANYDRAHYRKLKEMHKKWPNPHNYSLKELKTLEPFMRNLLYIVQHLDSNDYDKAWEYVAIGSDFDGMVDPLDICADPLDLSRFYEMLQQYLPVYADDMLHKPQLITRANVQQRLNGLFYENGEAFIKKHFK